MVQPQGLAYHIGRHDCSVLTGVILFPASKDIITVQVEGLESILSRIIAPLQQLQKERIPLLLVDQSSVLYGLYGLSHAGHDGATERVCVVVRSPWTVHNLETVLLKEQVPTG